MAHVITQYKFNNKYNSQCKLTYQTFQTCIGYLNAYMLFHYVRLNLLFTHIYIFLAIQRELVMQTLNILMSADERKMNPGA